jgi:ABC-type multidrug transport system fused ATPase/permease subunit
MRDFLAKIFYLCEEQIRSLPFIFMTILFSSLLEMVSIGIIGPFISVATNSSDLSDQRWFDAVYGISNFDSPEQLLLALGFLTVFIFYTKTLAGFYIQTRIFNFGFMLQAKLSIRLMRAYMEAPYTFHLKRNSTEFIKNLAIETNYFSNNLVIPFLTSMSNTMITILILALLIKTSAVAVVIIASVVPAALLILHFLKGRMEYWGKEGNVAMTEIFRIANHGLGGLKEARIIGCEKYFTDEASNNINRYAKNMSLAVSFSSFPRYIVEAFLITFLVLFTIFFSNSLGEGNLSSVLGTFAIASIRLLPTLGNTFSSINGMRPYLYSMHKLYFDLRELENLKQLEADVNNVAFLSLSNKSSGRHTYSNWEKNIRSSFTQPFDRIIIDGITYCYPNSSHDALKGISLEIAKGESIGLIGRSGAGKSTLVDLILGLLIPQSGDIRVDGSSIYSDLRSWQQRIGYVPQSIFLLDDTLEKNVAFGIPDDLINRDRVIQSIQAAQLSSLLDSLPNGLETRVGERGILLSGGQRQRIGLARVLYLERDILIFDEATSALDNETENLVSESIKKMSGRKTMIIIAHRLSTIEHCDLVYVLDKGQVVNSGKYDEVVSTHG